MTRFLSLFQFLVKPKIVQLPRLYKSEVRMESRSSTRCTGLGSMSAKWTSGHTIYLTFIINTHTHTHITMPTIQDITKDFELPYYVQSFSIQCHAMNFRKLHYTLSNWGQSFKVWIYNVCTIRACAFLPPGCVMLLSRVEILFRAHSFFM